MSTGKSASSDANTDLARLQARIDELEMRGAFHDQTQSDLSDALASESKRINALQAKIENLEKQLEALFQSVGTDAPEPPPPHY